MEATVDQHSAFRALLELERLGRAHAAELPAQEEHQALWEGVAFRLGTRHFVSPMDQVVELLRFPELAPVPRTRPWVRGIANVRGNLLPVMDLSAYLEEIPASLTRSSRVLVIDVDDVFTGLLVDEVFGMRHFQEDQRGGVPADLPANLEPYVNGSFGDARGTSWLLFSMEALAHHPQFLKVAG